jgi:hypothetical protein
MEPELGKSEVGQERRGNYPAPVPARSVMRLTSADLLRPESDPIPRVSR